MIAMINLKRWLGVIGLVLRPEAHWRRGKVCSRRFLELAGLTCASFLFFTPSDCAAEATPRRQSSPRFPPGRRFGVPRSAGGREVPRFSAQRRQRRRISQLIALKWLASTAQNAVQRRGCAVLRRGCAAGPVSTCRSCRFSGSIRWGDGVVLLFSIGSDEQAVGKPCGQRGDVVIRHEPALAGRDHQVAQFFGLRTHWRRIGSIRRRQTLSIVVLAAPCSPVMTKMGCGPTGQSTPRQPADKERPVSFLDIDILLQELERSPLHRHGQFKLPGGAAEHRRKGGQLPAIGPDLDGRPSRSARSSVGQSRFCIAPRRNSSS